MTSYLSLRALNEYLHPWSLCILRDRNIYYIIQEDDGSWTSGTIISDSSVAVYSFSEDVDVSDGFRQSPLESFYRSFSNSNCYIDIKPYTKLEIKSLRANEHILMLEKHGNDKQARNHHFLVPTYHLYIIHGAARCQSEFSWHGHSCVYQQAMPLYVVLMSNQLHAMMVQGELFIIDENNNIYYLPCGDLCDEEESTTTSEDDDEGDDDESTNSTSDDVPTSTTESYVYLGCYADDSNRVFSGEAYYYITGLTTEVRRGRSNICELKILLD